MIYRSHTQHGKKPVKSLKKILPQEPKSMKYKESNSRYWLLSLGLLLTFWGCTNNLPKFTLLIHEVHIESYAQDSLVDNSFVPQIHLMAYFINYDNQARFLPIDQPKQKKYQSKIIGVLASDTLSFYASRAKETISAQDVQSVVLRLDIEEVKSKYDRQKYKLYRDFILDFVQNADFEFIYAPTDQKPDYTTVTQMTIIKKQHMLTNYLDPKVRVVAD
jgi:hypothetical protein